MLKICLTYAPPVLSSSEYFALINILNESISMAAYSPDNAIFVGDIDAVNTFIDPRLKNHSAMTLYETLLQASSSPLKQLLHDLTSYAETIFPTSET